MAVERARDGEAPSAVIAAYGFSPHNHLSVAQGSGQTRRWLARTACATGHRASALPALPAHRTKLVKDFVQSTRGRLTLHILPGYAPELNPDEAVWSHMKRTGVARTPLREGERLRDKIDAQLASIKAAPKLVRSFFQAPSVAYIADW